MTVRSELTRAEREFLQEVRYAVLGTTNKNGSPHLTVMWYVLDGHVRFKADDRMFDAPTRSFMFIPRGTPHCFQNIGAASGRLLVITTPSGLERFFEQFAELLPGPVGPEKLAAVGHANWVEFVGPPVGVSDPL